jgi:hydrogenase maturation protease
MSRTLVVGLGNETRGDDAAGLLAARAVRKLGLEGVDVEEHGDVAGLAEAIARHSDVVLVDAVAGGTPGAVVDVELSALRRITTSSHGLDAREAVDLARVLGSQARVRVIGIVGRCFDAGLPPSDEVRRAAAAAALRIKEVLPCA